MPTLRTLLAAGFVFGVAGPGQAHEFWIEPLDFTLENGVAVTGQNHVGQMLKGDTYSYIPASFVRFDMVDSEGVQPVEGTLGDRPALRFEPRVAGLHIAVYQSVPSTLRYRKALKFEGFVAKEGLDGVLEAHAARGLPAVDFREAYTRFAKALVAVGEGAGEDRPVGLRLELIALSNPYDTDGPVRAEVRFEGAPIAGVQVAAFRRDGEGAVTRTLFRSDAEGRVAVPREDAAMTLLSAVHMVEPSAELAERRNVVWHSLWASLTYGKAE